MWNNYKGKEQVFPFNYREKEYYKTTLKNSRLNCKTPKLCVLLSQQV